MTQFTTPILFIVFNRVDTTQKVFDKIKELKPNCLFVAADGPRLNNSADIEKCRNTRDIINQVDWDCELKMLFQEDNLGCAKGVSAAITWFFENVEEGIILEDDCVPHPDFFPYCQELLARYRDNEKIWMISGDNFQDGIQRGEASYYFSAYSNIWGWASWRRAWKKYDLYMSDYTTKEFDIVVENYCTRYDEKIVNRDKFLIMKKQGMQTWDYQFFFYMWKYDSLSISPNANLVQNIGFGEDATHFVKSKSDVCELSIPVSLIFPLTHPNIILQNKEADYYYYRKNLHKSFIQLVWRWVRRQILVKPQFKR